MSATSAAVFRPIGVQQDLHFRNRVEVDLLRHEVARAHFVRDHAVDDDVAPVAPRAANVRHIGAEAHAERIDRVLVAHAGKEPHNRGHVAPEDLHLFNLRRGDEPAALRFGGIHLRAAGFDGHRFAESDLERQVPDRQTLGRAEDDVLAFERAEVRQFDPDRVRPWPQVGVLKVAALVAHGRTRIVGGFIDDRDAGTGNHLALLVDDRPRDRPGDGLG